MRKLIFMLTLSLMAHPSVASENNHYLQRPDVQSLINELTDEGLDRQRLEALFASARQQQAILEAIARPAERTLTWAEYRRLFIRETRIKQGLDFWLTHQETLARAEKQFAVPEEIIAAIIGVETNYGRNKGSWRVLDALVTLGFDYPPRAQFFRGQLKHLFMLEAEAGIDPAEVTGSYAGAMGYPQFIPSSYRAYAIDFDGDGKIDLLNSPVDAIGSVANYLAEHRWIPGLPVAARARVSGDRYQQAFSTDYRLSTTLAAAANIGATPLSCKTEYSPFCFDLPADTQVATLLLDGEHGEEFWLTTGNFYAITRYNHSHLYAMAVYHLSRELRDGYQQQVAKSD